jgi:predicted phosphodiesterase
MLTSVAVLSDIHGVLPALDAVLAEPDVRAAERIIVTGDIAAGPQPVEVLDRLVEHGERVLLVRGNADRELVHWARGGNGNPPDPIAHWAAAQLRDDQIELLGGLPHPVTVDVAGFGPVLFCHGSPRDDDEVVLVDSRMQWWSEVFGELDGRIQTVVCGHSHMPFVRLVDRRLVINSGSIGMPYGSAGAHWALLSRGAVQLRRTDFDIEQARTSIRASSSYPDVDEWTDYFLNSRASDFEALAIFGPRDGRPASTR